MPLLHGDTGVNIQFIDGPKTTALSYQEYHQIQTDRVLEHCGISVAILTSVICLGFLGETINLMTLGGLALAVGILVDDATVEIENDNRILAEGRHSDVRDAILEGAQEIAVPAMLSTLCICIVFLPMFSLKGVAHFLFQPLAEAVIFAMLASYLLSRTLVPTMAMYLLKVPQQGSNRLSRNPFTWAVKVFDRNFERLSQGYKRLLTKLVESRCYFTPAFLLICFSAWALVPWLGQDFFPTVDSGRFLLHFRPRQARASKTPPCFVTWWKGGFAKIYPARNCTASWTT
jgi:multidrug efflux pump subunit AcrB